MIDNIAELQEALMVDLESDSDIAACEAACEIADYAMESAAFEYDGEDTAAMEAADNAIIDKFKDAVKTVTKKIRNFVKAAIRTIRMILPKLKMVVNQGLNKFRTAQAERMSDRVAGITGHSLKSQVRIASSVLDMLKKGLKQDPKKYIATWLATAEADYKENDGSATAMGGYKIKRSARDFIAVPETDPKAKGDAFVTASDAKEFLDKAVGYLNSLNASTGLEAAWIKKAKTSLKTTAIRRAMIDSYNIATEAVRKYYHSAMTIAQKFVDADKEYNRLAENKNGEKKGKGLKAYDKKYNIKEA